MAWLPCRSTLRRFNADINRQLQTPNYKLQKIRNFKDTKLQAASVRLEPSRNCQRTQNGGSRIDPEAAGLETVFQQAMRPVLTRCADAILAKTDLAGWRHHICPLCGGEPDLAVITPAAERLLICSRCAARWRFDQIACPFCLNDDRTRITSLASRDGQYRLSCCDSCHRYIKAFDARRARRPVMPAVDGVATLPLDAAAIQRGYQ